MKLSRTEYNDLIKRNPSLAPRDQGVCPAKQEQVKRVSLDRVTQGKDKSLPRFAIRFEIYARRPCDWDNYWTKAMQDAWANAGIIHVDAWDVLEGSVRSRKAKTDEEVGMVITLTQIQ